MKGGLNIFLAVIGIGALLVASGSFYIVDETQQVVVTQFGELIGKPITKAGLYFKTDNSTSSEEDAGEEEQSLSSDSDDSPKKFSPGKANASSTWKSDSVASRTKGTKGANDSKEADKAPLNITQDLGNPLYNE